MSIESVVSYNCMDYICAYLFALCCCSGGCDGNETRRESINVPISVYNPSCDIKLTIRTANVIPIDIKDEPIPKPIAMTPAVHHSKSPDPIPILIRAHT